MPTHRLDVEALYRALDVARRRLRISWHNIADATGVSPSTFSRISLHGRRPDADALMSILTWLATVNGSTAPTYTTPVNPGRTTVPEHIATADISADTRPPLVIPAPLQAAHAQARKEFAAAMGRPDCPPLKQHYLDGIVAGLEQAGRLLTVGGFPVASEHTTGRWVAVLSDNLGFVYDDAEDASDGVTNVSVVRGTAAPVDKGRGLRMPGSYHSGDVLYRLDDLDMDDEDDTTSLVARWEQAQAVAALLNLLSDATPAAG
jgi:transcriptional regulator with XRE-family HTH domain